MKPIFEEQYHNLLQVLNRIAETDLPMLRRAEEAITAVETSIQYLKQFLRQHSFSDVPEEIAFYKDTLPFFQSLFIYYANIFRIERNLPPGEKEERVKMLHKEQKKIRAFLTEHKDFVTYYELGKSYQDILYFTKQFDSEQRWQLLDIYAFGVDKDTCTRYSVLLAAVLAYKKLHQYLEGLITPPSIDFNTTLTGPDDDMTWQGSITGLGELIIGLYVSRVVKNPKLPLAKFAKHICKMFGVEPFNIHKVKEELRLRKKSRTPFFDTTRLNLLRFWDEEDLNAL